MNFRPELAAKVMAGEKTVTRRLVNDNRRSPWFRERCGFSYGQDFAVCPGRGKVQIGRAIVLSVAQEPLGVLTDAEARREGFDDAEGFMAGFEGINGAYDPDALVWRIDFERLG